MVKVLLAEDHVLVRQGLIGLLNRTQGVEVVGETGNGTSAVDLAKRLGPDVVLMDVGLPGMSGPVATRQITEQNQKVRVLALSAYTQRSAVDDMFRSGASGYLVKDCVMDELVEAIETVVAGGKYLSRSISESIESHTAAPAAPHVELTSREVDVLRLLANGKAMKEAAVDLRVSIKTIETHRRNIMEKLQLFSVAELTKHAIREGYCSLD